jgi:hypothetical protein
MKHDQSMTTEHEQQMLEHFRTHTTDAPSAAMDAQILAAARAAVEPQPSIVRQGSFLALLHAWLFGERTHQRWSLVLAGVACLGIGVSLTWRNFEQRPTMYDAVPASAQMPAARQAPMAAPAQLAAPAPEMRARTMHKESAVEGISNQQKLAPPPTAEHAEAAAPAPMTETFSVAADASVLDTKADVQDQLEQLLKLRLDGKVEEAAVLLQKVKREHPALDVEERLRQMQEHE